jgi:signal transduction histidine kinase
MRGPQDAGPRDHDADGTWHARDVTTTSSTALPGADSASGSGSGAAPGASDAARHEGTGPGFAATRRLLARVGVRTPFGRDVVLAAAWTVVTVALLGALAGAGEFLGASRSVPAAQMTVVLVLAVVQCLPLALRRRWPVATLLAISVVQACLLTVLPTGLAIWTAAPVVAAYTVGTLLTTRRAVGVLLVAVGVETVGAVIGATGLVKQLLGAGPGLGGIDGVGSLGTAVEALALVATAVLVNGISASVGSWVALRRRHEDETSARAAESVEHQATLTRSAVAAERTRMARELHDIAAHHLTGLVVQAGAAERLVDVDPERAKESLRSVRSQGRETLDSLRSIVGILRETGDGATGTAPVPGLRDVGELVEAARAGGTVVDERADGEVPSLAPLADVTAYRTVQEALANARRHAPDARVLLTTTSRPGRLVLLVENDVPARPASSAPAGYGLVGMRERAALVGGLLEAGTTAEGTWRVRLELPVEAEPGSTRGDES